MDKDFADKLTNSLSQQIFPWYPNVIKYQNAIVNSMQTCVKTQI